jgi:peptidoglycan lytic transglycosylase
LPRSHTAILGLLCAAACTTAATASGQTAPPSLTVRPAQLLGHTVRLHGTLSPGDAGRTVLVQRQAADGTWAQTATAVVADDGTFLARWRARQMGHYEVRATMAGATSRAAGLALTANLAVYRPARATFFGPHFYGKPTACGETMSRTLLGVAHRSLPCGTPVEVMYHGQSITVPVVDRGPFTRGVRFDLTSATAQALGMTGTSTVGVIPHRGEEMAPPPPFGSTGGVPAGL